MDDVQENGATKAAAIADCLAGGGEMGALMRALDWSKTPLGPVESWPQSLRTALSILLNSRYPMFVFWGPQLVKIYNDAYRPITADKHPWALGRPGPQVWPEIWADISPLVDRALAGEATWSDDLLLFMHRRGFPEEVYFTFSYSPIRDESGGVGGMLCACTETTAKVLSERRLRCLRDLTATTAQAKTVADAEALCLRVIEESRLDIPFAALYRLKDGVRARLVGSAGVKPGAPAAPEAFDLAASPWPLARVAAGEVETIGDLRSRLAKPPTSVWGDPISTALVLPISDRGQGGASAALVLGVNPRRALDDDYRSFLNLVAGNVATTIANARAYEEERKRADALTEIDRAKTLFFSNVSHEFRTPLTLMLGPLADTLAKPDGGLSAAEREPIALAYRNGLRLLKLVNTLLDFSRIEAGRAQASYEPTDLAAFTADLASNFRSACEKAGLMLAVDCPPLPEPIHVDRDMWEKIILNLVSNAFKYTHLGEIVVTLRPAGDAVELAVRDTGVGIPEAELPRIFERFHRVEGAVGRTYEGSGIGLTLVQDLVKLHGGTVRVDSVPGQGTTFTVSVPRGSAHLPADRIGAARALASTAVGASAFVEEALRWLPDGEPEHVDTAPAADVESSAPVRRADVAPDGPPARILWADDNADMRDYVRRLLSGRYDVEAVADGASALAAARASPPDLVLADVMMPRLDGFGLLRELRADPRTRGLPIILLSARAGEESRIEGLEAGASDYLTKPFSARELLARVDAQLNMARLSQALQRELADRLRAEEALQAALQDKEVLLHELQHRTKNNLAVIASLLGLKAKETPHEGARRDIEDVHRRVETLALVHEQLLSSKSVEQIELAAYLRELCAKLCEFAGVDREKITLRLALDDVTVSPDQAIPLGLIVNEIVSNSLEHAFPDGRGALQLQLSEAGDGKVRLVVADDGLGIPADAKAGSGRSIIRALAMQIRADVRAEAERGTRYTLTFPA